MPRNHSPISDWNLPQRFARFACMAGAALVVLAATATNAAEDSRPNLIERLPDGRDAKPSENSVFFPASSAKLDVEAMRVISRHIEKLLAFPHLNLTLVAHTDELGSTALEIARGQDRLNVVLRVLEEARIPARRIRSINLGSELSPAENCNDDPCRQLRRRIDFLFHR